MNPKDLRSPEERVGSLAVADLPPPRTDVARETLLRQALLEGDEDAFARAVRTLAPDMTRVAMRYVRAPEDAEDVIQDTWVAALAAAGRFEGRSSLSTWLFRILSYRARDAGRRSARWVTMSQLASDGGGDSGLVELGIEPLFGRRPSHPDDGLLAAELRGAVARALVTLPARQRRVFALRDLRGQPARRVCERLGVSPANQRVLLHRARARVRSRLAAEWGGDP